MNNTEGKKELIQKLLTSEVIKEEHIKVPKKIKGSRKHKKVSNSPKVVID